MSEKMTASQALRYIKKLKGAIDDAKTRAGNSVSHKENARPPFDFKEMLSRYEEKSLELARVQGLLASANAAHHVTFNGASITLAHAVRVLQEIKGRISWVRGLSVHPSHVHEAEETEYDFEISKHVRKVTRWTCVLPESEKAALIDDLQEQFDRLNNAVETANQTVVLTV